MYEPRDLEETKKPGMFELKKENERNVVVYGVSRGDIISIENLDEHVVSNYCLGD